MSGQWVVLLRGINVGGKHKVGMADLRAALQADGHTDVRTVLQSGNVVLSSALDRQTLQPRLTTLLGTRFGFDIPVVVRSAVALEEAHAACPFETDGIDPRHLHLLFLDRTPDADAVAALDPDRSPGDRFVVDRDHVYLHLPSGAARTKLTVSWLERALGVTPTGRNWRTVERLITLTR